ncbi:YhcH/YjgK/YiaL family protein [Sedimentibacter saalensis]|uniref:YhcH/YjgK/YiaL family protein n=1 Tax=Sedimentibacter saalensis TaxID=130788 RepID=UPI0028997EF3|nr:YhcH/YjgK/YiaL family protein [Sedimentibacter saalensis]
MIYGNLNNFGNLNAYPKMIYTVLEYLRNIDLLNIEPGKYEIEGKNIYYTISDSHLDVIENKKPEAHKQYIDIQLSLTGGEIMGFAIDTGKNPISQDLLDEKDILYYESVENERFIKMNSNDFFVFFPWDIHRPGCTDIKPINTKKVVVKINNKLF